MVHSVECLSMDGKTLACPGQGIPSPDQVKVLQVVCGRYLDKLYVFKQQCRKGKVQKPHAIPTVSA